MTSTATPRSRLALLRPALLGALAVPALAATGGSSGVGIETHLATTAVMGAPPPILMVILGASLVGLAIARRSARLNAATRARPAASAP